MTDYLTRGQGWTGEIEEAHYYLRLYKYPPTLTHPVRQKATQHLWLNIYLRNKGSLVLLPYDFVLHGRIVAFSASEWIGQGR